MKMDNLAIQNTPLGYKDKAVLMSSFGGIDSIDKHVQ